MNKNTHACVQLVCLLSISALLAQQQEVNVGIRANLSCPQARAIQN